MEAGTNLPRHEIDARTRPRLVFAVIKLSAFPRDVDQPNSLQLVLGRSGHQPAYTRNRRTNFFLNVFIYGFIELHVNIQWLDIADVEPLCDRSTLRTVGVRGN